MGKGNQKDYFRKPYLMNSYRDMMKATPLASTEGYRSTPHSEFEKPYRDISYPQMQNIDPNIYRRPYDIFNYDFDNDSYVGTENRCNSNLSIGPFDPIKECGSFQVFQPSGKPPFEFFIIEGPGTMDGNIWIAPECPYTSQSSLGDLVSVGLIDSCSGKAQVQRGGSSYPSHTSIANFRLVGDDFEEVGKCIEEGLIIIGEDAPVDDDCYTVIGGVGPYTWSIDVGSIDASGCVTVTGECGPATITVIDSCGNIGNKVVRMPIGVWVDIFSEEDDPSCIDTGSGPHSATTVYVGANRYRVNYRCRDSGDIEVAACIPSRWIEAWNGVVPNPIRCELWVPIDRGAYWIKRWIQEWQCP